MQAQRFSLGIAGVLAACFFSLSAQANSTGIVVRSGKQGSAQTCMAAGCHNTNPSAKIPTVSISGPTTLAAGTTGQYTLIIQGGEAVKAGMNVAVSDNGGTLSPAGGDLKVVAKELTHTAPKTFTGTEARFDFSLVAPTTGGNVTLFASGNSTNGNANNDGDHSASTTLDVQITGGSNPPDAGTPDAGGGGGGNVKEDAGGCSAAGGAPIVVLLALVAAAGLRRRAA